MIDIATLTPDERLELIEQLWNSLSSTPDEVPFSNAHREELDRRLDELEREGPTGIPTGIPAEDVLSRLRSRHS